MTKQDFELIARVIDSLPLVDPRGRRKVDFWVLVNSFVVELDKANSRFDPDKFRRACTASENVN